MAVVSVVVPVLRRHMVLVLVPVLPAISRSLSPLALSSVISARADFWGSSFLFCIIYLFKSVASMQRLYIKVTTKGGGFK